ncbi:MAG: hypothetical protein MZV65_41325 [Chromatiales bacterium]|nr:hypothetical protein [Chromatiales bacterium]
MSTGTHPRPRRTTHHDDHGPAKGMTRWLYDHQPQGHRHAVPVVLAC